MTTSTAARAALLRGSPRPARLRWRVDRLALAIALLMFVSPLLDTLRRWRGGWVPGGDHAIIEFVTRQVGTSSVLVGVYSRYGWHHPGPALFYLLAVPYRLLGSSSAAMPLTALVVNAACVVAFAVLLYRRAGSAATVWGLLVLLVYVRQMSPGLLRDVWNPYLPLLPFTVLVLAAWSLVAGDRWLAPLVVGLGSFCVQSHVGYLVGVVVVWALTAVLLLVTWFRRRRGSPASASRWRGPALVSLLVVAVLWAPPVIDAVTGHPGNLTLLYRYFRSATPTWTYERGFRDLATMTGWLPGWLTGQQPEVARFVPPQLPVWTGLVALVGLLVATGLAVHRRDRRDLSLCAMVVVVGLGSVFATRRVVGPLFVYLVPWSWTAGLLLWVAVGVLIVRAVAERARSGTGARAGTAWRALAVPPLVALLLLALSTGQREAHARAGELPAVRPLTAAVLDWLGPRRQDVVTVEMAPTFNGNLTGTSIGGYGMVLALTRAGVDVQMPASYRLTLGRSATDHLEQAKWVVVVALTNGRSPPPAPGQQLLGSSGDWVVYGGPAPNSPP